MSGSIIPVAVGIQATQLSGSTPDNYTIYNTDTANAVWIANKNSVKPSLGMRLGPLGTLNWQKTSGLAYACVDTGVAAPVVLNVSNDITDIVNPVDVATATAIAILAHGVPNVILTETLFNGGLANNGSISMDVSGQGCVIIHIRQNSGAAINVGIQCTFTDASATIQESFFLSVPVDPLSGPGNIDAAWEIPVSNSILTVVGMTTGASTVAVTVVGSNRIVPKLRQLNNNYVPRVLGINGVAFAAGVSIQLPATDTSENVTRFNGPVKVVVFGNAAALAAGYRISMAYATPSRIGSAIFDNANLYPNLAALAYLDWYHPPVPVLWFVTPAAANAGPCQISLQIVPAGAGL